MGKKWTWIFTTLLLALAAVSLCREEAAAATPTTSGWIMEVGESINITNNDMTNGTGYAKTWHVDDASVAEIAGNGCQCRIEAKGVGTTRVTVNTTSWVTISQYNYITGRVEQRTTYSDTFHEYTIQVKKEDTPQPTSIKLSRTSLDLVVGTSYKLTYTLRPAGASATVTFSSSNPDVASVDAKTGYITAQKAGNARITARTSNGIEAVCQVKVTSSKATGIKLDKKSLTVEQGKTKKLTATLSPAGAAGKITWKSSNPKIASVKNGTVKGLKKGTVTITAKLSSKIYAKCKVTVPIKPKSIKLNKKKLALTVGNTYKLTYKLSPKGAKGEVAWSSSKPAVVSVNKKNGSITAKKAGTATITVKTLHGKKASCKVTVKALTPASITLSAKNLELRIGEQKKLTYTLNPKNAESKVTLTSNKPEVASIDKNGKVTARKKGTATVTAKTANGKRASCKVTVKGRVVTAISLNQTDLTMSESEQYKLSYVLSPAQSEGKVSWSSSDDTVVSVDQNGKITAQGPGNATVTAQCENGVSAVCKIKVKGYITGLYLLEYSEFMKQGTTQTLEFAAYPTEHMETLQWISSNPSVASIDRNGKVAALSAGTTTITVRSRDCEDSYELRVLPTDYVDISKDIVYVYDNYYQYSFDDDAEKHPYDPQKGIAIVQSSENRSHSLGIGNETDDGINPHVILAGVHLDRGIEIYTSEGDVSLELLDGTNNYIDNSERKHCLPLDFDGGDKGGEKGRKIYITGNGNLEVTNTSTGDDEWNDSAISIKNVNLIISSGSITAAVKAKGTDVGVISIPGSRYYSEGYGSLTISSNARVTAVGGSKAVDASEEARVDIAPGSLKYLTD